MATAKTLNSVGGVAMMELSLTDPNRSTGYYNNLFDESKICSHKISVVRHKFNSWKVCDHRGRLIVTERFEEEFSSKMSKDYPLVWARFGIVSESGQFWRDWEPQIITNLAIERAAGGVQNEGHEVIIQTCDLLYGLTRGDKTAVRKGKISDIVVDIVTKAYEGYGIKISNTVVEPTATKGTYIQSNQSDFEFITRRMTPRAMNAKGKAGYKLAIIDGTLHFHTVGYSLKNDIYSVDYYSTDNTVTNMSAKNVLHSSISMGAAGTALVSSSPLAGAKNFVKSYKSDAGAVTRFNKASFLPKTSEKFYPCLRRHEYENPDELRSQMQHVFSESFDKSYTLDFVVNQNFDLRLFDIVDFQTDNSFTIKGKYAVGGAQYTILSGVGETRPLLTRGDSNTEGIFDINAMQDVPLIDSQIPSQNTSVLGGGGGPSIPVMLS
jgi:hypothetical protein